MKNVKAITKAIDNHFNNGVSLDDTALELTKLGVKIHSFLTATS